MILRRLSGLVLVNQAGHGGSCRQCCVQFARYSKWNMSPEAVGPERNNNLDFRKLQTAIRQYSTTTRELKEKTKEQERAEKAKEKRTETPPIVLLDEKGNFNVMTLEEAGKLAKKKGLNLIEVDTKAEHMKSSKGRTVYKLMSQAQFYGEDFKSKKSAEKKEEKKQVKDEKTVIMKSKSGEHDVLVKVNSIKKWVEKGHTVRVFIGQAGERGNPEGIFKVIEDAVKDEPIRIVQKVVKGSQIKFQLMPPKAMKTPNPPPQPKEIKPDDP